MSALLSIAGFLLVSVGSSRVGIYAAKVRAISTKQSSRIVSRIASNVVGRNLRIDDQFL